MKIFLANLQVIWHSARMKFICRVVCWFFLLAPFAYAAGPGSSANDFTRSLKGKVVFLRGMEPGDELNFDAQGVPIGSDIPGSFCNSGVRVTNVHLSDSELKIKGERVTLVFFSKSQSPSLNDLRIIPLPEPVEITIRVDASHPELMNAAIRKVLAGNPREALSGMSPDSETDALDSVGSTLPREQIPSDPPSSKAAVYKPGSGVSPPRLIHAVEPEYTDDAK